MNLDNKAVISALIGVATVVNSGDVGAVSAAAAGAGAAVVLANSRQDDENKEKWRSACAKNFSAEARGMNVPADPNKGVLENRDDYKTCSWVFEKSDGSRIVLAFPPVGKSVGLQAREKREQERIKAQDTALCGAMGKILNGTSGDAYDVNSAKVLYQQGGEKSCVFTRKNQDVGTSFLSVKFSELCVLQLNEKVKNDPLFNGVSGKDIQFKAIGSGGKYSCVGTLSKSNGVGIELKFDMTGVQ